MPPFSEKADWSQGHPSATQYPIPPAYLSRYHGKMQPTNILPFCSLGKMERPLEEYICLHFIPCLSRNPSACLEAKLHQSQIVSLRSETDFPLRSLYLLSLFVFKVAFLIDKEIIINNIYQTEEHCK